MNATIGIYDDHELAVEAVKGLKEAGFPLAQLSIMGKAETEVLDPNMNPMPKEPMTNSGLKIGATTAIGTALGILTGVGVFAIPGIGVLYGAGALIGAIAGFDFGLMGGIASILATLGVKDENAKKYHDALSAGKFLVIADGTEEDVQRAQSILATHNTHQDLAFH
jgi:hypothetical protein